MRARVACLGLVVLCGCGDVVVGNFNAESEESGALEQTMALVVGADRLRALSLDGGLTWEPGLSEGPDPELVLYGVAYGDGQFIAVGGETTSRIERSSDGETWEVVYQGQGQGLRDVVYTGQYWIAVGVGGEVMRSSDGIAWDSQIVPIVNTKLSAVASDGDQLLLAVGDGDVIGSFNGGDEWLHKFDDGLPHTAVAYGGAFVVADADGTVHVLAENLADWVASHDIAAGLSDLIYAEGRYLAVGGVNLYEASDPNSWSMSWVDEGMSRLAHRNGRYLGLGGDGRFHSEDGVNWQRVATGEPGHAVVLGE